MLVEEVRIQRQVAVAEVLPVVEAQRQVALAALAVLELGQVVAEQQAAVVEYLSMAESTAQVEWVVLVAQAAPTVVALAVRVVLAEAEQVERAAVPLVLQEPQTSEAAQARQKAAPADQVERVGLVVQLAAEVELAALAQPTLQADQVALAVLVATPLPVQAGLVEQAESTAKLVLAELVEVFLLFLRPAAEAAGYSCLFRPWLPLPIGEIFFSQRRPTLLTSLKGC